MTDEDKKRIFVAITSLEEMCRGRACNDCPLDPDEDEYICAFDLLKEKARIAND